MRQTEISKYLAILFSVFFTAGSVSSYDEMYNSYFPVLTPPSHIYRVVTYNDGLGNQISGLTNQLGNVVASDTFEFDIYMVSCDEPSIDTKIEFGFYEDPFYSGRGIYRYDLGNLSAGAWHHVSIPRSSISQYDGMDWSKAGIFQIRGMNGSFDVWIDNVGMYSTGLPLRIMVDGINDAWGHNFAVPPAKGVPPAAHDGNATHIVYVGGSSSFGNISNGGQFDALMIMLESLQGLLLKNSSSKGLFIEPHSYYTNDFNQLKLRRTFISEYIPASYTPWSIVGQFADDFSGQYVLCDITNNPDSLNVARMAAHLYDAVIVDTVLEESAQAKGLTRAFDGTDKNDQWIFENWLSHSAFRTDIAIDQSTTGGGRTNLNEYAAATGAICFREDSGTQLRLDFLDALDMDSPVLGWPEEGYGELPSTLDNSLHDTFNVAMATHHNVGFYSSFRSPAKWPLSAPHCPKPPATDGKHYVCFVWSDGDNPSWDITARLWHPNWWANPQRGQCPVGWGISPSMRDLGAVSVEYMYETAVHNRDGFFAFGSIGYSYPAYFSESARQLHARRMAKYMEDLDLRVLQVLDKYAFESPEVYEPYLAQSQIDGMFYWDVWGNYARYEGDIKWVLGKPIISCRMMFSQDTTASAVAAAINARPKNPLSEEGYSLVGVGAWDRTFSDIVDCVNLLDENVVVVTPEQLMDLVRENLTPPLLETAYSIDTGDSQFAPYGAPTGPGYTLTTHTTEQRVDDTPSTKVQVGSTYQFCNMEFSPVDLSDCYSFDIDIYGDAGGAAIRLELFSSLYGFIYKDLVINFNGWRHFSWNLDGSDDGLLEWPMGSRSNTLNAVNIFQISGSWNGTPGTFYIDNAIITRWSPYDLNRDGFLNMLDIVEFCGRWLTADSTADFDDDGFVDLMDWSYFSPNGLTIQ